MLEKMWNGVLVMMVLVLSEKLSINAVPTKVCVGTDGEIGMSFSEFETRYRGCTHILGNFVMVGYNIDGLTKPKERIAFIENILEITGYLNIYMVNCKKLSFSSLRVVRGQILFRVHVDDPEYALLVRDSNIDQLEFPELREISNGSVGMYFERRMCFLETINWKGILNGESAQFHYFPAKDFKMGVYKKELELEASLGNGCSNQTCDASCEGGCWGKRAEQCQKINKLHCSYRCQGGRCYADSCCHSSCVGGCFGPKRSDCFACKNVFLDGECKEGCPNGKYSLASTCVRVCPSDSVVHEEEKTCLMKCPSNKYPKNGKCESVRPPQKLCRQPTSFNTVHSGTINHFQNCTILDGSIRIDSDTFSGGFFFKNFTFKEKAEAMHPDSLSVFSTLQEISGTLSMTSVENPEFVNLTYFMNLESIGSRYQSIPVAVLYIQRTSLEVVSLRKLRRVHGSVLIEENSNLCYVDTINWAAIADPRRIIWVSGNKAELECKEEKQICSAHCSENGCWGPETQDCVLFTGRECPDVSHCEDSSDLGTLLIAVSILAVMVAILVIVGVYCWRNWDGDESETDSLPEKEAPVEARDAELPPNVSQFGTITCEAPGGYVFIQNDEPGELAKFAEGNEALMTAEQFIRLDTDDYLQAPNPLIENVKSAEDIEQLEGPSMSEVDDENARILLRCKLLQRSSLTPLPSTPLLTTPTHQP